MSGLSTKMASRIKTILRLAIILLVIAFWGAYLRHNWDSFLAYRWQLNLSWLLLACLVAVVFWAMLAFIWQRVLILVGGSLGVRRAVRLWAVSMLGRYVPGGVWHIAGRVYMAEKAGESGVPVFISTVIEQILSLLGGLLTLLVSLPFWHADYARLAPVLILTIPLSIAVHPAVLRRLTSLATRFASKAKPSAPGAPPHAVAIVGDSPSTPGYGSLLVLLIVYTVPNLIAATTLYLSAAAVGPVSPSQLPTFAGAYAIGLILGYFSFFAPSGLGVREGAIALLLTPTVGAPVAVAASALSRLALSLGEAAVIGVCYGIGDS